MAFGRSSGPGRAGRETRSAMEEERPSAARSGSVPLRDPAISAQLETRGAPPTAAFCLRPVTQLALKSADAGLLPRVVVMETAEDDVQGRGEGAGTPTEQKLSCDEARDRRLGGVRGQEEFRCGSE